MAAEPTPGTQRARATLALFAVSVIWGFAFLWMKQAVDVVRHVAGADHAVAGSGLYLVLRFGLAAVLLCVFLPSSRRGLSAAAWRGGAWLGILLVVGFVLQMTALEDVTPAVSAFLTSLYVLFLAILTAGIERRAPRLAFAAGALLATAGAALVRGRPEIEQWSASELLTVLAAVAFAVHILVTDRVTRRVAPMPVTLAMFVWVALGGLVIVVVETARGSGLGLDVAGTLLQDGLYVRSLLLTTMFGTVVALTLMNQYQRELDPVRAAILYALEPIWAAAIGIYAGEDRATGWLFVGGGLLLAGNLVAELAGMRPPRAGPAPRAAP